MVVIFTTCFATVTISTQNSKNSTIVSLYLALSDVNNQYAFDKGAINSESDKI